MGIFSFGKKDDAPNRRGANTSSTRAARGERVERRTRRTERTVDADAMLLDPTLPEKQRARRRLVGAVALVVAAVVILPMVLDSHPKPVTDDISIDIPSRPAPKVATKTDEDTQAGVAPDNPAPDAALAASGLAPATAAKQGQSGAAKQQSAATSAAPAAKPAAKPQAPARCRQYGTCSAGANACQTGQSTPPRIAPRPRPNTGPERRLTRRTRPPPARTPIPARRHRRLAAVSPSSWAHLRTTPMPVLGLPS